MIPILFIATTLHLYLDETVESKIVSVALTEAGMQDDVLLLDSRTLVLVHREPRSLIDFPEGPLCAFSKYETPHPLVFWKRVTCCRLCLWRGRHRIVDHLRYKAEFYRRMMSARLIFENTQWNSTSRWQQSLARSTHFSEKVGNRHLTFWMAVPQIESWPSVRPVATVTLSRSRPGYMPTGRDCVRDVIERMESLAYE